MVLFLSFYSTRREDRLQKVLQNIPFQSRGIFPLILGEVRMMGLNSPPLHKQLGTYVPHSTSLSLAHVDVHARAHQLYTLRVLWCISSTIGFTLVTINNIQIHYVRVQRCTSLFGSRCSGFRLWTKIFTTT